MDKQKSLTKETPILIYGAGEVGNNCSRGLRENGFNIIAVLDANKCGEYIVEGLYTYKLGTEPREWNKADFIVVICLANGMIHKNVADKLYDSGYCYIVFLPMNHCIPDKEKRSLTRIYNYFLSADSDVCNCVVSDYGKYTFSYAPVEDNVLSLMSKKITVWMNLEMLFSESIELWEGDKTKINGLPEYNDKNIASQYPVENIFDYFDMNSTSYELYFKIYKKAPDKETIERELRQREELYRLYKREHERGMDFFIEAAPEVVWNPRNYCNLVGGHHRTLFLLHEGHSLFPVKMRMEDFNKWENKEVCDELITYIDVHNIKSFYAPLPHPSFLNFPVRWEDTGKTKLAAIMKYVSQCDIKSMTVLDCSDDEGYYARCMDRIGAKETVFLNNDRQETELAALFNRLLYREAVKVERGKLEDLTVDYGFDMIFAVESSIKEARYSKAELERLGILCRQYLFMETTCAEEIENIKNCTGSESYQCIHREYRDGIIWELGVYSTPGGVIERDRYENYFYLDNTKEYLIYGAGGGGLKLIQVFDEKGYRIKGFIDQRAAKMGDVRGWAVWSMETLKELENEAENIVIVITTKNVFEHDNIVQELSARGFRQCIYKPLSVLRGCGDEELEKISKAHDAFLIDIDIPHQQKLACVKENYQIYYKDRFLISRNNADVLTRMPLELLFNYKESDAYENLGMAVFFPLENLYRAFMGTATDDEQVLEDFYCYSREWACRNQITVDAELKKSMLSSRWGSYSQMKETADCDDDYFYRNAPFVESGDCGRFHMTNSGRNRIVFQAAKGYHNVLVRMKPEDYDKWIHKEVFDKVWKYMERERVNKLFAPCGHPYLKDIPSENIDYYQLVCFPIAKYIIRTVYCRARRNINGYYKTDKDLLNEIRDNCRVFCDLDDTGAVSRYLRMCGFSVGRKLNNDKLTRLLDELFYQNCDEMNDDNGKYEVLIVDDITKLNERTDLDFNVIIDLSTKERLNFEIVGYVHERDLGKYFDGKEIRTIRCARKNGRKE